MPAIGGAAPLLMAKGASRPCLRSQARPAPTERINKTPKSLSKCRISWDLQRSIGMAINTQQSKLHIHSN
jgi:hypothetical protein